MENMSAGPGVDPCELNVSGTDQASFPYGGAENHCESVRCINTESGN